MADRTPPGPVDVDRLAMLWNVWELAAERARRESEKPSECPVKPRLYKMQAATLAECASALKRVVLGEVAELPGELAPATLSTGKAGPS